MATYEAKKLYRAFAPATSFTNIYTVPAGKTTIVKQIIIHNPQAVAASVYIADVATGHSGPYLNRQFFGSLVVAGDTITLDVSIVLEAGDELLAYASGSSSISLNISGQVTV